MVSMPGVSFSVNHMQPLSHIRYSGNEFPATNLLSRPPHTKGRNCVARPKKIPRRHQGRYSISSVGAVLLTMATVCAGR